MVQLEWKSGIDEQNQDMTANGSFRGLHALILTLKVLSIAFKAVIGLGFLYTLYWILHLLDPLA